MIRLTERAAAGLKNVLTSNATPKDQAVKLVPSDGGGVRMVIDSAGKDDEIVDGGNRPLLIVDAAITSKLDNVGLDVEQDPARPEDPRFVLRGPARAD